MAFKPSNFMTMLALLIATVVWGMWGGSYQGVIGSIPLLAGGVVTFIAFYLSFLRAFGDGQIPEDSLKILNYWSFPGQIVGVAGMGWNTLLHFHQTGFDYAIAFLGACGCAVLVIGNIVEVTAAISAGRQRVGKAVAGMGDD